MKHLFLTLSVLVVGGPAAFGQGLIAMSNYDPLAGVQAPVFESDGTTRLTTRFVAQLWVGSADASEEDLQAVGEPIRFLSSPSQARGFFRGGHVEVPHPPGEKVSVQVRAWPRRAGDFAAAQKKGLAGKSAVFQIAAGRPASDASPPSPAPLEGLRSFALAGSVASVNALGVLHLTVPEGASMIANPFDSGDNRVGELFAAAPDGVILYKYRPDSREYEVNSKAFGEFDNPDMQLAPGDGVYISSPSEFRLIFAGEVPAGMQAVDIASGLQIRSSMIPQPGHVKADLGFPVKEGDQFYLLDRSTQAFDRYTYIFDSFEASPAVAIGEAFWVKTRGETTWYQYSPLFLPEEGIELKFRSEDGSVVEEGELVVEFDGDAALQTASNLTGPWTDRTEESPATIDVGREGSLFFRLRNSRP